MVAIYQAKNGADIINHCGHQLNGICVVGCYGTAGTACHVNSALG
jgi:hypothetical protein